MRELFKNFSSHESLLAIGISLVIAGIILRTFARSGRRAAALHQQHLLHHRKLGEALRDDQADRRSPWLDRHLSLIANTVVCVGLAFTLLSFFRH